MEESSVPCRCNADGSGNIGGRPDNVEVVRLYVGNTFACRGPGRVCNRRRVGRRRERDCLTSLEIVYIEVSKAGVPPLLRYVVSQWELVHRSSKLYLQVIGLHKDVPHIGRKLPVRPLEWFSSFLGLCKSSCRMYGNRLLTFVTSAVLSNVRVVLVFKSTRMIQPSAYVEYTPSPAGQDNRS